MKTTKVTFKNKSGLQLSAQLELPIDQHPYNFAIFAHCFTCNKNLKAVQNVSRALSNNGIAVLRFDFTGLGASEGDFADTNFSSNVSDLLAAARYLKQNYQPASLLIGHSLGGAAVLQAALQLEEVKAVATIGAPATAAHVGHLLENGMDELEEKGEAMVNIGGRPIKMKKQFLADLEQFEESGQIKNLKKALLILHSPQDNIVSIDEAANIYKAAMHPKSFISLDGADHLLSDANDSNYVGEVIGNWSKRYLELPKPTKTETDKEVVVVTGKNGYTTDVMMSRHSLVADEPESLGGDDFGPSPFDLLTASLGACTSMTLRMYADHKGWDVEEIKVHLNHSKVEQTKEGKIIKIDCFEREIEIEGNLDDKQKRRMLEIADKCPVHKTLHNDVEIVTSYKS